VLCIAGLRKVQASVTQALIDLLETAVTSHPIYLHGMPESLNNHVPCLRSHLSHPLTHLSLQLLPVHGEGGLASAFQRLALATACMQAGRWVRVLSCRVTQ
jgi:hypothetical protein